MRALRREAPLLLLLLYGGAFAYAAFGRGVPAFDDHPGQLFRLWHALERSLPSAAWTADWNPDWWGGYPELQFYPPGLALAGAALRAALLAASAAGDVSPDTPSPGMGSLFAAVPPNNAFENGRSQAWLRTLAHAVQRGR